MRTPLLLVAPALLLACADDAPAPPADASPVDALTIDAATFDALVAAPVGRSLVTYVGATRLHAIVRLSDGTWVVGGAARSLDWLDAAVPRTVLAPGAIASRATGSVAFLLHLSADLARPLRLAHFPPDTVRDIVRIRTTEAPGAPTGDLYISGTRDTADRSREGYFIARLDANFVAAAPRSLRWSYDVVTPARGGTSDSAYRVIQPWDVGGDGKVVYGGGLEYDYNWAFLGRLTVDGAPDVVPMWRAHYPTGGGEFDGLTSEYRGATPLGSSVVPLKAGRKGSLRSSTMADHAATLPDGNGRTDRRGRWPDDYYFSGPCALDPAARCPGGPGYTGYRASDRPTQRLGGVAVDRRTNTFFFGYSTQTVLPDGQPDFEPAVVAMAPDGALRWWSRLYTETPMNSTPDQYVDGLAYDASSDTVVVLARSHGNNVQNLWSGNTIAATPGASGFQNRFTGNSGNIHVSWLGRLRAADGALTRATWEAQYVDGATNFGAPLSDPNLAPWPDPNQGWPDLNTTRCSDLSVGPDGRVAVACTGRRTITTNDAAQRMTLPGMGPSSWNEYVRVYTPDLSRVVYSTLVTGRWDLVTGAGGGNTDLSAVWLTPGGVAAVGAHNVDAMGVAVGNPVPTVAMPPWGRATPTGASAIVAHFNTR